jgi:hypothetical protein
MSVARLAAGLPGVNRQRNNWTFSGRLRALPRWRRVVYDWVGGMERKLRRRTIYWLLEGCENAPAV